MTRTDLPPFFVGGPVHGKIVPRSFASSHDLITIRGLGADDVVYLKSVWWQPLNQSCTFFFDVGLSVGEMVEVMAAAMATLRADARQKRANRGNL